MNIHCIRPAALAGVLFCLGAFVSAAAAPPGFSDPRASGPYAVGFSYFLLHDPSRADRPIPVHVWYPADPADVAMGVARASYPVDPPDLVLPTSSSTYWEAYGIEPVYDEPPVSGDGPFPIVMFSPGWGATAWDHIAMAARVASHGFVVAIPYHWGDGAFFNSELIDPITLALMNRPLDMSFMLDALLERNATAGDLFVDAIDPSAVAASGWSLGGYAAMVLAGGDDQVCDTYEAFEPPPAPPPPPESCVTSWPDPRVKAIVTLDGSTQYLHFYELARISVPTLGIGEEWDHLAETLEVNGQSFATWQARLHAATGGQPAYRVDIGGGANHDNFSDLCEASQVFGDMGLLDPGLVDILVGLFCSAEIPTSLATELESMYMIAFLKTNLVHEAGYQSYLTPGYALKEPYVEFFRTEKRNPRAIHDDWPGEFTYFPHQPGKAIGHAEMDPATIEVPVRHAGL